MIALRMLTPRGIENFRSYIQMLKEDPDVSCPDLTAQSDSYELEPRVEIDDHVSFFTRLEMGKYLRHCFAAAELERDDVLEKPALWTWLAYLWFDQLCPVAKGARKVLETARYVCSTDYRDYYRHFVASSYDIYSRHGEKNSRLFLLSPVNIHNDFVEQIASRQYLISNANFVEAAHGLYWDNDSESPKRGAQTAKNPGSLRRFITIIGQLELTYDIYTMSATKILDLLPKEFDWWKGLSR